MLLIPLYSLVGKGEDRPGAPKLYEERNDAIVVYMLFLGFIILSMDRIDVIASCMIFREPMCFLKPLYRDCISVASYVHN